MHGYGTGRRGAWGTRVGRLTAREREVGMEEVNGRETEGRSRYGARGTVTGTRIKTQAVRATYYS